MAISAKQSDCVVLVYQNMVVGTSYWVVPVVLLHIPTHETASNDQCTSAILIVPFLFVDHNSSIMARESDFKKGFTASIKY
jgi:hypothetical protein